MKSRHQPHYEANQRGNSESEGEDCAVNADRADASGNMVRIDGNCIAEAAGLAWIAPHVGQTR